MTGVTYEISCDVEECDMIYHGETGRNAFTRGGEHLDSIRQQDTSSPLWRHTRGVHSTLTQPPNYNMKVTGVYRGDATLRQITEAVRINNTPEHRLMNDRAEWGHTPMTSARTVLRRV